MIEVVGNLWTFPASVRVITTNGFVRNDGRAVMGRGCALEATKRFPKLPRELGDALHEDGNHVHWFPDYNLVTFPVKHNWWEEADLALIEQSAEELYELYNDITGGDIVLPSPGCGNGRLSWEKVREVIAPILVGDHYKVIDFER